ncbi:MOS1T-like protein [Mya arenaria]|uniref:MOS1T-like protein n=1 Tax=Mya arenaria TaxID=6604 RepID=A0ABY7EAH1_MYAAR|nr:MOS1T-like protein [Mya arenaria]
MSFLRRNFINRIVTTDETWLYHFDPETKQQSSDWRRKSSPPLLKAVVRNAFRKNMCIFFRDICGMLIVHAVRVGQTVIRRHLLRIIEKRPGTDIGDFLLHHDKSPAHRAESSTLEPVIFGLRAEHAPYIPDLAPMELCCADAYLIPWTS